MNKFRVTIRVSIYQHMQSGGGLTVENGFDIPETNFMELCKLLARFEELTNIIKKEKGIDA